MTSISDGERRQQRRQTTAVKDALRELNLQLALLNHRVGASLELRDVDLDCLDIVVRHGPLSPSALARRAGLHPATMTGIVDRLERGGWAVRGRDPSDRRAVLISAQRDRTGDLFRAYAGMNGRMDDVCAGYTEEQLDLIADFLRRAADAGQAATDALADDQ